MKRNKDVFGDYFRKKYPKENYTPTEILNFRNELEKKYGKKIIPELKEEALSDEEVLARIEYSALSDVLRQTVPEMDKLDKQVISHIKVEQKASGRLANIIFLILKLASFVWGTIMLFLIISDFSFDSFLIFLVLGLVPLLLVILLEVFYWYVAGIIEFDDIFPTFKNYITGMFK